MNENIIIVAEKLISEATAIVKYTEDIKKLPENQVSTLALLEDIRLDEVEHIQKLTVELTALVTQSINPQQDAVGTKEGDT